MATYAFAKIGTGFTYQKDSGEIVSDYNPPKMIQPAGTTKLVVYFGTTTAEMTIPGDTITINGGAPSTNTAVAVQSQLMSDVF